MIHPFGIEPNPHLLFWFYLPLLPLAFALILFLYFQQRRLASTRSVLILTALRFALLLMLAILFLRPVKKIEFTTTTSGTLWFLVDQSPSMQSPDAQATPVERLRWADALGYLPAGERKPTLDLQAGELLALQSDLSALHPADAPAPPEAEPARVADFSKALAAWTKKLDALRSALESEPGLSGVTGASSRDAIDRVSAVAHDALQAIKHAQKLRDASAEVDWPNLQENLNRVIHDVSTAADEADADFLHTHAADSDLASATNRVAAFTRGELAWDFLTAAKTRTHRTLADLLPKYRVRIASFADSAQATGTLDAAAFPDLLKSALNPANTQSQSTNITAGLQLIAEQIPPDEPASIIILSDGRHNVPGDPAETARFLAARGIRVYGLLVGSHAVSPDAAVDQVDAPEWIFKGDTLRATALIRLDGLAGKTAHVELRRAGTVVDSQNVPVLNNQSVRPVDFTDLPPDMPTGGVIEYEVRVTPLPGEVNLENNRSTFRVAVKKDKLYALIVDDLPRWEYLYLSAQLQRDPRIKLQKVLFDPAQIAGVAPPPDVKASPTNPKPEAQILPATRDEWQAFDLIILGDIGPDKIPTAQQQFIAAAVRDKGATLITLAGPRHMPADYINTPLAELLPVTLVSQFDDDALAAHLRTGFRPGLAPEGNGSVLGQLGINADANADLWANMPLWFWHSPYTQAKPSASVLWSITEPGPAPAALSFSQARKTALLSTLSIGLGKTLHLASDQSWRLRQVNGVNVQERFWNNVLGWAVGSDLPAGGKFVRFGASQPRYAEGQPVEITARVLQENLVPYTGLAFSAVAKPIRTRSVSEGPTPDVQTSVEAAFQETDTPGYYRATLAGLPPGDVEISLKGPEVERLLDSDPSVTQKTLFLKILPQLNLERRNMNTDPALLARIAQAGNGFALDAHDADLLAAHLPAIQRSHTTIEHLGFFTDPAAQGTRITHWSFLALFALLLTAEWLLRKYAGLV